MPGQLLISDANILIDMGAGGLIKAMFKLDCSFAVPDILFEEELKEQHAELPGFGLKILELGEEAVTYAEELSVKYEKSGAGRNDLIALALAAQEKCPLLTGDSHLREVCVDQKVDVHGTIWLVGKMIEQKVIGIAAARRAYSAMRKADRRLPWDEVNKQLGSYGK
ncbi:MAG: PIN domain-containing protein [Fimbriimonadaceae bacterium]